jgi:hypothetical protein
MATLDLSQLPAGTKDASAQLIAFMNTSIAISLNGASMEPSRALAKC